ncbi:MAG: 4Fe-4S cluster-binding domain-containing protein, partial [Clostridia bacterium]|nr:4Fe-4S cluster-binding domain-containing protein [Clostridia bacterium]
MNNYCNICPNRCNVLRGNQVLGKCGVSNELKIAKYYLHPYEEPIISGKNGSGTVFFSGCSLKCAFCQNYELSRAKTGKDITPKELSLIFKELVKYHISGQLKVA